MPLDDELIQTIRALEDHLRAEADREDAEPPQPAVPTFGELVSAKRAALGMSARELAKRIGKSPTHISALESGDARIDAETISKLSDALSVERAALLAAAVDPVYRSDADGYLRIIQDHPYEAALLISTTAENVLLSVKLVAITHYCAWFDMAMQEGKQIDGRLRFFGGVVADPDEPVLPVERDEFGEIIHHDMDPALHTDGESICNLVRVLVAITRSTAQALRFAGFDKRPSELEAAAKIVDAVTDLGKSVWNAHEIVLGALNQINRAIPWEGTPVTAATPRLVFRVDHSTKHQKKSK